MSAAQSLEGAQTPIQIEPGGRGIVYYPAPFRLGWSPRTLMPAFGASDGELMGVQPSTPANMRPFR